MIGKTVLENLYRRFNRREYVHPDPLEFLYAYPDVRDREIAALVASSLAYGRVARILKSVEFVLGKMGPSPCRFLQKATAGSLARLYSGFKHRFTTGENIVSLLSGIRRIVAEYGSLNQCFVVEVRRPDGTILPALEHFAAEFHRDGYPMPSPEKGSACKRLNLFLRWMVRKDAVDPGGWTGVPESILIVPLDVHMARIGRKLGLTKRKTADMRMALDVTGGFRKLAPEDPVKYDFVLTRFGIRGDLDIDALLAKCSSPDTAV